MAPHRIAAVKHTLSHFGATLHSEHGGNGSFGSAEQGARGTWQSQVGSLQLRRLRRRRGPAAARSTVVLRPALTSANTSTDTTANTPATAATSTTTVTSGAANHCGPRKQYPSNNALGTLTGGRVGAAGLQHTKMTSRMSVHSKTELEGGDHTDTDSVSGIASEITTVRHNYSFIGRITHK